jgi:2,3-dihydroxybiphenyl 1,2-dioxygenase
VRQLGYLGIGVSDLDKWENFATRVLGLQSNGKEADGTLFLKMDENHHRFAIHPRGNDDLAYAGWEVQNEQALLELAEQLQRAGVRMTTGTHLDAKTRRVRSLMKFADPNGIPMEVYYGPLVEWDKPFHSPRAISGFETGTMGLGHIVIAVDNYEESLRFYRDLLGMRISDFVEFEMTPGVNITAAFMHCNQRHHSIAIVQIPNPKRLRHFMLQTKSFDDVGRTLYLCEDEHMDIAIRLGRHSNDHMTSF